MVKGVIMKIHEGLYAEAKQRNMTLSEYMEEITSTPGAEEDTFQRHLSRLRIDVKNGVINDFYTSEERAILFPEFIRRSVSSGKDMYTPLDSILASKVYYDTGEFENYCITPKIDIYLLSTFVIQLQNEGLKAQREKLKSAIDVLSKDTEMIEFNYTGKSIKHLFLSFEPYKLTTIICHPEMASILSFSHIETLATDIIPLDTLICLDNRFALQMIRRIEEINYKDIIRRDFNIKITEDVEFIRPVKEAVKICKGVTND